MKSRCASCQGPNKSLPSESEIGHWASVSSSCTDSQAHSSVPSMSPSPTSTWHFMEVENQKRELANKDESIPKKQKVNTGSKQMESKQSDRRSIWRWVCGRCPRWRGSRQPAQERWTYTQKLGKWLQRSGWRCTRGSDSSKKKKKPSY